MEQQQQQQPRRPIDHIHTMERQVQPYTDDCGSETICERSETVSTSSSSMATGAHNVPVAMFSETPEQARNSSPWRIAVTSEFRRPDSGEWQTLNTWCCRLGDNGVSRVLGPADQDACHYGGDNFAVGVLASAVCAKLFAQRTITSSTPPVISFFQQLLLYPFDAPALVRRVDGRPGLPVDCSKEVAAYHERCQRECHQVIGTAHCTLANLKEARYERPLRDEYRDFAKTMKRIRRCAEEHGAPTTDAGRDQVRVVYWLYWPASMKHLAQPAPVASMEPAALVVEQRATTPVFNVTATPLITLPEGASEDEKGEEDDNDDDDDDDDEQIRHVCECCATADGNVVAVESAPDNKGTFDDFHPFRHVCADCRAGLTEINRVWESVAQNLPHVERQEFTAVPIANLLNDDDDTGGSDQVSTTSDDNAEPTACMNAPLCNGQVQSGHLGDELCGACASRMGPCDQCGDWTWVIRVRSVPRNCDPHSTVVLRWACQDCCCEHCQAHLRGSGIACDSHPQQTEEESHSYDESELTTALVSSPLDRGGVEEPELSRPSLTETSPVQSIDDKSNAEGSSEGSSSKSSSVSDSSSSSSYEYEYEYEYETESSNSSSSASYEYETESSDSTATTSSSSSSSYSSSSSSSSSSYSSSSSSSYSSSSSSSSSYEYEYEGSNSSDDEDDNATGRDTSERSDASEYSSSSSSDDDSDGYSYRSDSYEYYDEEETEDSPTNGTCPDDDDDDYEQQTEKIECLADKEFAQLLTDLESGLRSNTDVNCTTAPTTHDNDDEEEVVQDELDRVISELEKLEFAIRLIDDIDEINDIEEEINEIEEEDDDEEESASLGRRRSASCPIGTAKCYGTHTVETEDNDAIDDDADESTPESLAIEGCARGCTYVVVGEDERDVRHFGYWLAQRRGQWGPLAVLDNAVLTAEEALFLVHDATRACDESPNDSLPIVCVQSPRIASTLPLRFLRKNTETTVVVELKRNLAQHAPVLGEPLTCVVLCPSTLISDLRFALRTMVERFALDPREAERVMGAWTGDNGAHDNFLTTLTDADAVVVPIDPVNAGFDRPVLLRGVFQPPAEKTVVVGAERQPRCPSGASGPLRAHRCDCSWCVVGLAKF